MARLGMTIPLTGIPLHAHRDVLREMVDLGYTDFWSSEAGGHDGFTPLAMAAARAMLTEVATDSAYAYIERLAARMRSENIGSRISIRNGPTSISLRSAGARREPWKACCSPSWTMLSPQSTMPRFG